MSPEGPPIRASHFIMPKEGASLDECEDATGLNVEGGRFALADGATEAFDAGSWARALAEGWVGAGGAPLTVEEFKAWVAGEGRRLQESWSGRELPWYAEEKARGGSFAAFVGLSFEGERGGLRWRAIALGDACVVQRCGGAVRAAMPLSRAEEFHSSPALVPSHGAALEAALAHAVTAEGTAEAGDTFLLLSDAAAAWFFKLSGERAPVLEEFDSRLAASDNEALAGLFRRERGAGRIKDDDVAVVRVAVGEF
jgi:hypothetical protein